MKTLGMAAAGLVGGGLLGFALSVPLHFALEALGGGTPLLVAAGLLPYVAAVAGAVAAPLVAARRGGS